MQALDASPVTPMSMSTSASGSALHQDLDTSSTLDASRPDGHVITIEAVGPVAFEIDDESAHASEHVSVLECVYEATPGGSQDEPESTAAAAVAIRSSSDDGHRKGHGDALYGGVGSGS